MGYPSKIGPDYTLVKYPNGRLSHVPIPADFDLSKLWYLFARCKGCGDRLTHPAVWVLEAAPECRTLILDRQRWHAACAPRAGAKVCNMRQYLISDGPVLHRRPQDCRKEAP